MVKYAPLEVEDAKWCLGDLVIEIDESIAQLHDIGLSHNDVRLENICFNDSYKSVFIDLERCMVISKMHTMFGSSSFMYSLPQPILKFRGSKSDYFQLGWLVAWVLDECAVNYHDRT